MTYDTKLKEQEMVKTIAKLYEGNRCHGTLESAKELTTTEQREYARITLAAFTYLTCVQFRVPRSTFSNDFTRSDFSGHVRDLTNIVIL